MKQRLVDIAIIRHQMRPDHLEFSAGKAGEDLALRRLKELRRRPTPTTAKVGTQFKRQLARLGGMLPSSTDDPLQAGLMQAGLRGAESMQVFLGSKILLAILFPLLALMGSHAPIGSRLFSLVMLAAAGFYLPTIVLARMRDSRVERIGHAIPDALDLLVVCVEAGLGLSAAFERVARETSKLDPDLSQEFLIVNQEIEAGLPRAEALRNLAIRSGSEEVRGFVGMLILSDRLGTGIARALRSHADAVRSRRRQRAEELARQAGTRLAFPLVFLILPPLFVILLGPAFMEMMHAIKGNL